jgi:hypothetical protein
MRGRLVGRSLDRSERLRRRSRAVNDLSRGRPPEAGARS